MVKKYALSTQVTFRCEDIGGLAFDRRTWAIYKLNQTGYTILEFLSRQTAASRQQIHQHLDSICGKITQAQKNSVDLFFRELVNMGFDTGFSESPITPVIVGESHLAKKLSDRLYDEGMFALPIVFPMVARDKARIRTMMNAGLSREQLDKALGAFEKLGKELQII